MLITEQDALIALCKTLETQTKIAIDTEFLRERTYFSQLCLIQVAWDDGLAAIDPLAENIDLAPFLQVMKNPDIVKIFHACRQDVEIFWQQWQVMPQPLFDTQIAAMVLGYGEQVSYENLSKDITKQQLDKSARFSNWAQRPLTQAQIDYALSDVRDLIHIADTLESRLIAKNRVDWVKEEMAVVTDPATYEVDPDTVYRKIRSRLRKAKDLNALAALAKWRELRAQMLDFPRVRVLRDDALVALAQQRPQSVEDFATIRLPGRTCRKNASRRSSALSLRRRKFIPKI